MIRFEKLLLNDLNRIAEGGAVARRVPRFAIIGYDIAHSLGCSAVIYFFHEN